MKMTSAERKNYQSFSKSWLSAVKFAETRRIRLAAPTNCDLYHYAGNNPVRYIDPNGRNVENNSNQYLIVKPESSKQPYVLLAPNETYIGEQDGIILSDGTTYKTYGEANFKVQNKKDGNISVKGGVGWTIVGNFIKTLCNENPKRSRKEDYYGKHKYEGAKTDKKSEFLHSWLEGEKNLDSNNDGKTDKQDFEVFNLIDGGMPPAKDTENRWKENRL